MDKEEARGNYGKRFVVENIVANPLKDADAWSGEAEEEGDAGLQLWVRSDHSDGYVGGAELATFRRDALYGTFRVGMKLSSVNGTCGAFFFFHSNEQEIDMEFLSWAFEEDKGAVHLVLQSPQSADRLDASDTSTYKVAPLPFAPDDQFHEYRFDWTPSQVTFYVDGEVLTTMTEHIPHAPGPLHLNHWSNGDHYWSAGPPAEDTAMTVSYVKAYFNSTEEDRSKAYRKRCKEFDPAKVCSVPAQTKPPHGNDAQTYFFSQDETADKTPGQETFKTTNAASSLFGAPSYLLTYMSVIYAAFYCISYL